MYRRLSSLRHPLSEHFLSLENLCNLRNLWISLLVLQQRVHPQITQMIQMLSNELDRPRETTSQGFVK